MNRDVINLEIAAGLWIGTPFCERSAVRGAGACCHAAVLEVLFDAGWLERFVYPIAPLRGGARVAQHFFAHDTHFMLVSGSDDAAPGDVLQFRLGSTAHFMLRLPEGRLFHCAEKIGAIIAPNLPPAWERRLANIWRPK